MSSASLARFGGDAWRIGTACILTAAFAGATSIGLWHRRRWARWFAIIGLGASLFEALFAFLDANHPYLNLTGLFAVFLLMDYCSRDADRWFATNGAQPPCESDAALA